MYGRCRSLRHIGCATALLYTSAVDKSIRRPSSQSGPALVIMIYMSARPQRSKQPLQMRVPFDRHARDLSTVDAARPGAGVWLPDRAFRVKRSLKPTACESEVEPASLTARFHEEVSRRANHTHGRPFSCLPCPLLECRKRRSRAHVTTLLHAFGRCQG